jgi:hypothetical protein
LNYFINSFAYEAKTYIAFQSACICTIFQYFTPPNIPYNPFPPSNLSATFSAAPNLQLNKYLAPSRGAGHVHIDPYSDPANEPASFFNRFQMPANGLNSSAAAPTLSGIGHNYSVNGKTAGKSPPEPGEPPPEFGKPSPELGKLPSDFGKPSPEFGKPPSNFGK